MNTFVSTRGDDKSNYIKVDFETAILNPNASFGGLYTIEKINNIDFSSFVNTTYNDLVKAVFLKLGLNIDSDILTNALVSYKNFDNPTNPAPLSQISKNIYLQNF